MEDLVSGASAWRLYPDLSAIFAAWLPEPMCIVSRPCISADGHVTTPDGWPSQTADPTFNLGQSHGIKEFLAGTEAALMGRTTFEPALSAGRSLWPNLDVFVLASRQPPGTPDHVVTDHGLGRLLERMPSPTGAATCT